MDEVRIQWQGSCRGRSAFKSGSDEITRFWIDIRRVFAVAIALRSVTAPAVPQIHPVSPLLQPMEAVLRRWIPRTDAAVLRHRDTHRQDHHCQAAENNLGANHSHCS